MKKSIIISILMLAILITNGQIMVRDTLTRQAVNDLLRSLNKISEDTARIDIKNRDTLATSFISNN